jgi:hypothetical protein
MAGLNSVENIDAYIQAEAPNSPITGQMVINAANTTGVDPEMIMAIMQQDSSFGTTGKGAKTFNPGNVGNDDEGNIRNYGNWQSGVNAVAQWLANHKSTSQSGNTSEYNKNILVARLGKQIYGTRISDVESERVQKFVDDGMKQNKSEYEIIDDVLGFKVTNNKDLAENLRNRLLQYTTEDGLAAFDMLSLARLLNSDNKVGAVNKVEKQIMGMTDDAIARESGALFAKQKGDDVTAKIQANLDKLGIIAGNYNKLKNKFVAQQNFQEIESDLTGLITEWRLKMAGSNVTETETKFLEGLVASVKDNPFNAIQKIRSFQKTNLEQLNAVRDNYNLPLLDENTLIDKTKRVTLYENNNIGDINFNQSVSSTGNEAVNLSDLNFKLK